MTSKVFEFPRSPSVEMDFLLFDFAVDSAVLQPEHREALLRLIATVGRPGHAVVTISVDGFASHTGTARHNLILSQQREQAVAAFLRANSRLFTPTGPIKIDPDFHGFTGAPPGENPMFRSVRVVVHPPHVKPEPVPPPPPPEPVPPPAPGLSQVTVWINAFINKDVKDGKGGFLTFRLTKGVGMGKSVIPGPIPGFRDCYLTDNRDFNSSIAAEARMHVEITIDFTGPAPVESSKKPKVKKCSVSQRFRISDGELLNTATGVVKGDLTPDPRTMTAGSRIVKINVDVAANNPVARGPNIVPVPTPILPFPIPIPIPIPSKFDPPPPPGLDPDIDVQGTITIDAVAKTVQFDGKIDRFPFFEMYASKGDGTTTETVFRIEPTPGDTPANLFGKANRDVATILGKPAKVSL